MAPHWAKLALPVALTLAAFIVGSQAQQQPRDSLYEEYGLCFVSIPCQSVVSSSQIWCWSLVAGWFALLAAADTLLRYHLGAFANFYAKNNRCGRLYLSRGQFS